MKQPTMKIRETGEQYKVASLIRLDWWTTLRAFPQRWLPERDAPMSYVIMKGEWEETEVNAELMK